MTVLNGFERTNDMSARLLPLADRTVLFRSKIQSCDGGLAIYTYDPITSITPDTSETLRNLSRRKSTALRRCAMSNQIMSRVTVIVSSKGYNNFHVFNLFKIKRWKMMIRNGK